MNADDDSKDGGPAWHERTSTVVGASIAALAVLALLWLVISYTTHAFNDPEPTSQYYPEPSGSAGSTSTTTNTSTETITSTSPPVTTDIDPGDTSSTSSGSSSGTTSGTDTTTSFDPSNLPRTRRSTPNDDGDTTTRQRPRLNETRTLYPRP